MGAWSCMCGVCIQMFRLASPLIYLFICLACFSAPPTPPMPFAKLTPKSKQTIRGIILNPRYFFYFYFLLAWHISSKETLPRPSFLHQNSWETITINMYDDINSIIAHLKGCINIGTSIKENQPCRLTISSAGGNCSPLMYFCFKFHFKSFLSQTK